MQIHVRVDKTAYTPHVPVPSRLKSAGVLGHDPSRRHIYVPPCQASQYPVILARYSPSYLLYQDRVFIVWTVVNSLSSRIILSHNGHSKNTKGTYHRSAWAEYKVRDQRDPRPHSRRRRDLGEAQLYWALPFGCAPHAQRLGRSGSLNDDQDCCHEGAGVVVAIGPNVTRFKVGDRAGIKWVADVCGECEMCTNGTDELQCPKQLNSGFTAAGTFQQFATATARYATRIPDGVSDEEAGPVSTLPFTYVPNGSPELTVHFQLGDVWRSYGIRSAKTIRCSRGTVGCHHGSKRWTRSLRCTIC